MTKNNQFNGGRERIWDGQTTDDRRPSRLPTRRWSLLLPMFCLLLLLAACSEPPANQTASETAAETAPVADTIAGNEATGHDIDEGAQTPGREGAGAVDGQALQGNGEIIAAHNKLGLLLHDYLTRDAGDDENVFLSPLSISLALSMVYNGAAGETASALADTLQFGDLELDAINEAHRALLDAFTKVDDKQLGIQLQIANSLWHRQGFPVRPEFLSQTDQFYRAAAAELDFAAPESVDIINDWVSDHTEGLIDNLIDRLAEDLVMLLVNTVYFKGDWTVPFNPAMTTEMDFRLPSGEEITVPMMYRDGHFDHYTGSDFEAVRLPYGDDEKLAMYVFLPSEQSNMAAFREQLSYANWNEWLTGFSAKQGEVRLPRIDVQYKTNLNDALDSLGMGIAFHPTRADFTKMVPEDASTRLSISDVVHQSVLKVDEEGTEAAAATSVGIRMTSMPLYQFRFTVDRPFFIAIRDDVTGALLFVGSIVDPS